MPAVTVENPLTLPRLAPHPAGTPRPIVRVATAHEQLEGAGFSIYRPFPGEVTMREADPFLLFDQVGPRHNGPHETAGTPWHPHRGFETVTYVLDGEVAHHDTNGGGGVIGEGDTQWMTAGVGILHDELPTERVWRTGGAVHAVQLWVNLPASLKLIGPRYQAITADHLKLITTADGGALIRIIAGDVDGYRGPGETRTPITYLHATVSPGAELTLPWHRDFNAMAYVLTGNGSAGIERRSLGPHQVALFGPGDTLSVRAATRQDDQAELEVLVLGGLPIRQPIFHHGPFVMNTRAEITQAIEDYRTGRLGVIPADQAAPRNFA